ncbi:MAG: hypothetical protein PHV39_05885 [Methanomicrobium sp.]|nr:hypothetical protein [Methanomicrobium sp.]
MVFVIMVLFLVQTASAYLINFESPSIVESDSAFTITGTSTLPAGFTTKIEFYKKARVGNNKVAEKSFTIQDGGVWLIDVDTSGWQSGEYTMSIPKNSEYSYGSSSTLMKMFTVTENPDAKDTATEATADKTSDKTASPSAEKTSAAPVPTTTPVSLWICPLGIFAALILIKSNFLSGKKD